MSYQGLFIKALAHSSLLADWQPAAISDSFKVLLNSEAPWTKALAKRIHVHFNAQYPNITCSQIAAFIAQDKGFIAVWAQQRQHLHLRQFNLQALPQQPAKLICEVPEFKRIQDLSDWLGLSRGQLHNYASNWASARQEKRPCYQHYHYHWISRAHAQKRLIEAPKPRMAAAQKQIYSGILDKISLHVSCHGFRKQHSCLSYVKPHSCRQVVIHMDLENFFHSVTLTRVQAIFKTLGYSDAVAQYLGGVCCTQTPQHIINQNPHLCFQQRQRLKQAHLAQGSPSSPALANLAAYKLDVRLYALARKLGANYSRYADDLAFSGAADVVRIARHIPLMVAYIAYSEGFSINHRKTRIMRQGVQQQLTSMVLNQTPNISRTQFDQLKALLFNCVKYGPDSQNHQQRPNFRQHLQGRIAHVHAINPNRARKLHYLFKQIIWP